MTLFNNFLYYNLINNSVVNFKNDHYNPYIIRYSRNNSNKNKIVLGYNKRRKSRDKGNLISKIIMNNQIYIMKQIDDNDLDEWRLVKKMFINNLECPYLIHYSACLKSPISGNRYIIMEEASMDMYMYMNMYEPKINSGLLCKIINLCLDLNLWMTRNLNKVHVDIKLQNIVVFIPSESNNKSNIEFKIIDMGLVENADEVYEPNMDDLLDNDFYNYNMPRRECDYQQHVLFSIVIVVMEICGIDTKLINSRKTDKNLGKMLYGLFKKHRLLKNKKCK